MMIGHVRIDGQLATLHALPRNDSFALLQIDLAPWHFNQLTRSDEHQQHQAKRDARWLEHAGFVSFNCTEEGRQFVRIDGREVRSPACLKHVLYVCLLYTSPSPRD